MEAGVEAIAQGALLYGHFFGRPDVLRKVKGKPSRFGDWSYEAYDCKLSKETKATTILQLSFYSELLGEIQRPPNAPPTHIRARSKIKIEIQQIPKRLRLRRRPNFHRRLSPRIHVGRPSRKRKLAEQYRVAEYSAYYRYVKERLEKSTHNGHGTTHIPSHASTATSAAGSAICDRRRRDDEHLSLVAGIRRQQRDQLEIWEVDDIEKLAAMQYPLPREKKPLHGSRESYDRVREQARIQVESKDLELPSTNRFSPSSKKPASANSLSLPPATSSSISKAIPSSANPACNISSAWR